MDNEHVARLTKIAAHTQGMLGMLESSGVYVEGYISENFSSMSGLHSIMTLSIEQICREMGYPVENGIDDVFFNKVHGIIIDISEKENTDVSNNKVISYYHREFPDIAI